MNILLIALFIGKTVTVSWDPNTEADLKGYVVSWGTQSQNYRQRSAVITDTLFEHDPNESGEYYYAVQAVDMSWNYSEFSEEVSVAVIVQDEYAAPISPEQVAIDTNNVLSFLAENKDLNDNPIHLDSLFYNIAFKYGDMTMSWDTQIFDLKASDDDYGARDVMLTPGEIKTTVWAYRITPNGRIDGSGVVNVEWVFEDPGTPPDSTSNGIEIIKKWYKVQMKLNKK